MAWCPRRRNNYDAREDVETISCCIAFSLWNLKKLFKKFDPYLLAVAIDSISNALLFQDIEHPDAHPFDADLIINIFFQQVYEEGEIRDE